MLLNPQTSAGLFAQLAAELPDSVVFSDERGTRLTCLELWQKIEALAQAMTSIGVRRGDRVAIRSYNNIEWSLWEYAAQYIAAVPVGIGAQWSDRQTNDVLSDCDATVLVVQDADSLSAIAPERLERCRLVCVIEPVRANTRRPSNWIAHGDVIHSSGRGALTPQCNAEDAATIIYTSGSTGKPKGIMHTHARVMAAVRSLCGYFAELSGGSRALSWMPMEHLFQRILNLVSLSFGLDTRILSNPSNLIASVRDVCPTYFAGVPFVYEQMLQAIESSPESFAACRAELRLMIVGAAPTSRDMLARFMELGFPIRQAYSTSECLVPIAANTLGDNRLGSVGRPNSEYAIRLADDGEIRVKGPGVFAGYLDQSADQSAALFDEDGYFKTGDFGYLDHDGYLFVTGRREDFFKTSTGRKIAPFEVESTYKRSPWIEHIVVVGQGRRHPVAIIQLKAQPAAALVESLGLDSADPERWACDERMKSAVLNELRKHDADLEPYKRVRAIVLLAQPLRVETGELTATLKVRREVVTARCEAQLSALRDGDDPGAGGKHAA